MTTPTAKARGTEDVYQAARNRWPCPRCGGRLVVGTGGNYWCQRCKTGRRL